MLQAMQRDQVSIASDNVRDVFCTLQAIVHLSTALLHICWGFD
jgi:hypothetical protein